MYISIYLCIYRWANDDDDTSLLFTILKTYTLKSLVIIYIWPKPPRSPPPTGILPIYTVVGYQDTKPEMKANVRV